MVHVPSLWLPILLAAGLVYVASSIIHMFLGYHRKDFGKLPDEDGVMDALRGAPAGDYSFPHPSSKADLRDEAFRERARRGPTGFLTLSPAGDPFRMGPQLAQWFGYCLIVSAFAGYVTGLTLGPGSGYMEVFRMSSTVAFGAYALAQHLPACADLLWPLRLRDSAGGFPPFGSRRPDFSPVPCGGSGLPASVGPHRAADSSAAPSWPPSSLRVRRAPSAAGP